MRNMFASEMVSVCFCGVLFRSFNREGWTLSQATFAAGRVFEKSRHLLLPTFLQRRGRVGLAGDVPLRNRSQLVASSSDHEL
jgi:hypothetical protein